MNLWEEIIAKGFELGRTVANRIIDFLSIKQSLEKSQGVAELNALAFGVYYARVTMSPASRR